MQTVVEEPSDCFTSSREDADGLSLRELDPPSKRGVRNGFELSADDNLKKEVANNPNSGPHITVLSMGQRNSTNHRTDSEELDLREQSKSARVPRSTYFGDNNPQIFLNDGKTQEKHHGGTPTFGERMGLDAHYINEEEQFSVETPGFLVLCLENEPSVPVIFQNARVGLKLLKNSKKLKPNYKEIPDSTNGKNIRTSKVVEGDGKIISQAYGTEFLQDEWSKRIAALKSLSQKIHDKMHSLPESSSRKALEAILSNLNKEQCQLEEMISESSVTEASEMYLRYRAQSIDFSLAKKPSNLIQKDALLQPTQPGSVLSNLPLNSTKDISLPESAFAGRRRGNSFDGEALTKSGSKQAKFEKSHSMLEERPSGSCSAKRGSIDANLRSYLSPDDVKILRNLLSSEFDTAGLREQNLDWEIENLKCQVREGLGKLDNHIGGFSEAYAIALSVKGASRNHSQVSNQEKRAKGRENKLLDVFTNPDDTSHDYSSATLPSHHAKSSIPVNQYVPIRNSMGDELSPVSQKENDARPGEARLFQKKKLSAKTKVTPPNIGLRLDAREAPLNSSKQLNNLLQYSKDGYRGPITPENGSGMRLGVLGKLAENLSGHNSTKSSLGLNMVGTDSQGKFGQKMLKRPKSPAGHNTQTAKFMKAADLSQNQSFNSSIHKNSASRPGGKAQLNIQLNSGLSPADIARTAATSHAHHRAIGSVKVPSAINSIQGFHQVMLQPSRAKSAPRGYLVADLTGDLSISMDDRTQRPGDFEDTERLLNTGNGTLGHYFTTQDQLSRNPVGKSSAHQFVPSPSNKKAKGAGDFSGPQQRSNSQIERQIGSMLTMSSSGLASSVASILKQVRKNSAAAGLAKSTSVKSNKSSHLSTSVKDKNKAGAQTSNLRKTGVLALVSPKNPGREHSGDGPQRRLFSNNPHQWSTDSQQMVSGTQVPQSKSGARYVQTGTVKDSPYSDPHEKRKELEAILAESKRVHELHKKSSEVSIAQCKSLSIPLMPGELLELKKKQAGAFLSPGGTTVGFPLSSITSPKQKVLAQQLLSQPPKHGMQGFANQQSS